MNTKYLSTILRKTKWSHSIRLSIIIHLSSVFGRPPRSRARSTVAKQLRAQIGDAIHSCIHTQQKYICVYLLTYQSPKTKIFHV